MSNISRLALNTRQLNLFFLIRLLSPVLLPASMLVMRLRDPERYRFLRINDRTLWAYRKGKWQEAETLAAEGLVLAGRYSNNWNSGNVIHNSHQVLGLLHLREGKIEEAVENLLAAGRTPGSPQLNSFGPQMVLARQLLEQGQGEAVLTYVDQVALFWAKENQRFPHLEQDHKRLIRQWKREIRKGKIPQHIMWPSAL